MQLSESHRSNFYIINSLEMCWKYLHLKVFKLSQTSVKKSISKYIIEEVPIFTVQIIYLEG